MRRSATAPASSSSQDYTVILQLMFLFMFVTGVSGLDFSEKSAACTFVDDFFFYCKDGSVTNTYGNVTANFYRTLTGLFGSDSSSIRSLERCANFDWLRTLVKLTGTDTTLFGDINCQATQIFNKTIVVEVGLEGVSRSACNELNSALREQLFWCTTLGKLLEAAKLIGLVALVVIPIVGIIYLIERKWPGSLRNCYDGVLNCCEATAACVTGASRGAASMFSDTNTHSVADDAVTRRESHIP